jgi:tRNA-dihydrouridine synthase
MNIWETLPSPYTILAPMEDVTDTVFRRIIISCGRPTVFFTEFTNVEGLASEKGDRVVSQRLLFTPEEKPIIAQIWGKTPQHFFLAAKRIRQMGYDGIDINMGCPEKSVVKHGCCAALINNKSLASEIIRATQEGAGELPVSVKTRIGFADIVTEDWIPFLLGHRLQALTIHGRTAKEESKVPAHWDEIGKAVAIKKQMHVSTHIIGNGDVQSPEDIQQKAEQYGVNGIMVGRGIFHNPYIFIGKKREDIPVKQSIQLAIDHLELFVQVWGTTKYYPTMKKYMKIYIQGFDGASELRAEIMETQNPQEAVELLKKQL